MRGGCVRCHVAVAPLSSIAATRRKRAEVGLRWPLPLRHSAVGTGRRIARVWPCGARDTLVASRSILGVEQESGSLEQQGMAMRTLLLHAPPLTVRTRTARPARRVVRVQAGRKEKQAAVVEKAAAEQAAAAEAESLPPAGAMMYPPPPSAGYAP